MSTNKHYTLKPSVIHTLKRSGQIRGKYSNELQFSALKNKEHTLKSEVRFLVCFAIVPFLNIDHTTFICLNYLDTWLLLKAYNYFYFAHYYDKLAICFYNPTFWCQKKLFKQNFISFLQQMDRLKYQFMIWI